MKNSPLHSSTPQEWPEHLNTAAPVSPIDVVPPVGEHQLNFPAMNSVAFEQFCWWLLRKDHTLVGCKRLGGTGTGQAGIDLFAFDSLQPDKLVVFECKCWKEFAPTNLGEAIDKFLHGSWLKSTRKFVLILAQHDIGGALAHRWEVEYKRLRQVGIDAELWTGHTLTLKVQAYPDILSKFFPWNSVQSFANVWMQRVAFYEVASKAFFDPREHVARWARKMVSNGQDESPNRQAFVIDETPPKVGATRRERETVSSSDHEDSDQREFVIDGTYRTINQFGESWHFKGPWFSLSAILPSPRFTHASAAITFNRPDMSGMTVTFSHRWMLERLLFAEGAPLMNQYRGFIVDRMMDSRDEYIVDLPHCRLTLQEEGVRDLAGAADALTGAMRSSLKALETAWSATNFPFIMRGNMKVALAAIRVDVWREIGRFVEEHDVGRGEGPWHMFDANPNVLKPFTEHPNERFNAGYHGVFYVANDIDDLSRHGELLLLWQPNELLPNRGVSSRDWWPCDFAFEWLRDELLPEVKRRLYERHFGSRWRKILNYKQAARFAQDLDEAFVVRDLRQRPLLLDGTWSESIVDTAAALQRFFHLSRTPEPYLRQHDVENLYRATAVLARGNRGYVGYAGSKLCMDRSPEDHADLICLIDEHIRSGRVVANAAVIDGVFRAMLELLDDSDTWVSDADAKTVRDALAPFARVYDDANLILRHLQ